MTLREAQTIARQHGARIRYNLSLGDGVFIVTWDGKPGADYFTDDLDDAVGTVLAEAKRSGAI